MAMMISWVAPVNPPHPYLENDPAPSFDRNICAFHLGFSLVRWRWKRINKTIDEIWTRKPRASNT